MPFEKPAEKVAKEIVREKWKSIIARHPEFQEYEKELEQLFSVEPYMKRERLHKTAMEIILTPEAELDRIKKKYALTDEELRLLKKYRELARKDKFVAAVKGTTRLLDSHESLRTLGARLQLNHKSGATSPLRHKVKISADDETIYHELAHAVVPAHLMRTLRIGPGAARIMSAMIPPHEDEAFAFAVSHHYLGIEPDETFFKWVKDRYGREMNKWDQKTFEKKYWEYRKALREGGLHLALKKHVGP